jgi:hypothetical protein
LSDTPTGLREGSRLAKGGRRPGFEGEITVFDGGAQAPYDRPNLSKDYLAGNAPEEWIPLHPRAYYLCASGRRRAHSCRGSSSIRRPRGGDQAPSPAESVLEAGLAQHRLAARAFRRPRGSEASPSMGARREAPTEAPGSRSPEVVTHHEQGLRGSDVVAGYHPRDLGQGKRLGQLVVSPRSFLTAEWRHRAMLNYELDPDVLRPLVPKGTELDTRPRTDEWKSGVPPTGRYRWW